MQKNISIISKRKKAFKAFTLVELIAVVSLLMLMATVSFPKYSQIMDEQRIKLDAAAAVQIGSIAESYYLQYKTSQIIDDSSLKDYIVKNYGQEPKSKYIKDGVFNVSLTDNGKANVSLGTIKFVEAGIFKEESVILNSQQQTGGSNVPGK